MKGFATSSRKNVLLQVQQTVRADFVLQVGEVTQVVEITATAGLLNTEDATVGTVIENKRIVDLPLNGRNFLQLVALSPNVSFGFANNQTAPSRQGGQRSQQNISVAGARPTFNRFTLDGIEDTDVNFLSYVFLPSIDELQEFKVQTGIYPAEFGRAITQINVSTKSGGNDYHGTVFEFLRNSALNAKNYAFTSVVPPKDPFRFNQYGFTLGGPIRIPKLFNGRNKLFFTSNFESLRNRKQTQSVLSVPSLAIRAGNFAGLPQIFDPATRSGSGATLTASPFPGNVIPSQHFDPAAVKLLEFIPTPNVATGSLVQNYQVGLRQIVDRDQFNQRIDFVESSKSNWFGRYSWSDEDEIQGGAAQTGTKVVTHVKQVVASNTRIFTPAIINEFRFGYNSFFNTLGTELAFVRNVVGELNIPGMTAPTSAAWGIPSLTISSFNTFGNSTSGPYVNDNQRYQWIDNISIIKGAHSLRAGVEFLNDHFNQAGNDFVRGAFAFDSTATQNPASRTGTGYGMADYLLGLTRITQQALALANVKFRALSQYYYVDDTWKMRPNLTVSLGLRYENTPPFKDASGTQVSVAMPFNDQTANVPDLSRHPTFIRSGKGDFYEGTLLRFNPSIKVARDGRLGDRLIARDNNDFAPRLGIAWSPTRKWTVRTGFGVFYSQDQGNAVFDTGRNLAGRRAENTNSDSPNLSFQRPFSNAGSTLQVDTPFAFANDYHRRTPYTMQYMMNIQRELSGSTVLEVGYLGSVSQHLQQLLSLNAPAPAPVGTVLSRRPYPEFGVIQQLVGFARGNYNGLAAKFTKRFSKGLTYLVGYTYSKSLDDSSGTRPPANEGANPNDNYNIRAEYGLSAFDTKHRFVSSVLYELPFMRSNRILGAWQVSSIVTVQTGNPIEARVGSDQSNTGNYADRPSATGQATVLDSGVRNSGRWFNTKAYVLQPFGTFGNAGRNTIPGPGIFDWDFSILKNFRLFERHELQFRFEAFNFSNHPNLGDPGNIITATNFGVISSARTTMRDLQFALK